MVSRAWKIGGAVLLAASCSGALGVPRLVRARITKALDERCHQTLEGACTFRDLSLAVDGVLIRDLTLRAREGRYTAHVRRAAVRLRWFALLIGTTQRVTVDVDGVELRGAATLPQLLDDLRRRGGSASTPPRRSRVRVDALHVSDINATLALAGVADAPIQLHVRQAGFEWAREPATLTARWGDMATQGFGARAHTGTCTVLDGIDTTTTLDCREFEAELDTERLTELRHAAEQALQSLEGHTAQHAVETSPQGADEPPHQVQARFVDGRVRVMHGADVIANLTPAGVTALLEGAALKEASFQLGGEDARQPSLSLSFNRMREPWQVDVTAGALPLRELAPWVPAVPWHNTGEGRAHLQIHVEPGDVAGRVEVSGDVNVENFGLEHRGLAHEPIDGLTVSLDGRVNLDLPQHRIATPGLNWQVNGVPFTVSGWAERDDVRTALDVAVRVQPMSCGGALRSLPAPVTGIAAGIGLTGSISGEAHIALDTRRLADTSFDYNVHDACAATGASWALTARRFESPFVQRVMEPGGNLRAFVTGPGAPTWVPIEQLPPNLLNAVISREDGGFYRHRGFSQVSIREALVRNVTEGRFAYGASTISMQLAKNVFLAREKTLVRKLQEVVLTWWLEQQLTKQQILELYLNVVEFGPGIYGVGPASRFFFAREPHELTPLQAIYLATLLPAPVPRFAIFQRGTASSETVARLRAHARAMRNNRLMSDADAEAAQQEVFAFRPRDVPVPGAQTLTVDPATTTDDMARAIAERAAVAAGVRNAADTQPDETQGAENTSAETPVAPDDHAPPNDEGR